MKYDAAQERGNLLPKPTAKDVGLTSKQIHEARPVRDAEQRATSTREAVSVAANSARRCLPRPKDQISQHGG